MTFLSKFVNSSTLPPVQKIVSGVVNSVTSGARSQISSMASSISESLTNKGQSFQTVLSVTAQKIDSAITGGSTDYAGFAGKDPARTSAAGIDNMRGASSLNANNYSTTVSPHGRVAASNSAGTDILDIYPNDIGQYKISFDFIAYNRPAAFSNVSITLTAPLPSKYGVGSTITVKGVCTGFLSDVVVTDGVVQ